MPIVLSQNKFNASIQYMRFFSIDMGSGFCSYRASNQKVLGSCIYTVSWNKNRIQNSVGIHQFSGPCGARTQIGPARCKGEAEIRSCRINAIEEVRSAESAAGAYLPRSYFDSRWERLLSGCFLSQQVTLHHQVGVRQIHYTLMR